MVVVVGQFIQLHLQLFSLLFHSLSQLLYVPYVLPVHKDTQSCDRNLSVNLESVDLRVPHTATCVPVLVGEVAVNCSLVLGELLLHVAEHGAKLLQTQHHLLQISQRVLRRTHTRVLITHSNKDAVDVNNNIFKSDFIHVNLDIQTHFLFLSILSSMIENKLAAVKDDRGIFKHGGGCFLFACFPTLIHHSFSFDCH